MPKADLSFLKKGIADMLSSRLAQEGRLTLVDPAVALKGRPEPANATEALALGEALKVDYIIFGSITLFGDSVSTDARLIDIGRRQPAVTFNQFGKSQDDAIAHVNAVCCLQINEQVLRAQAPKRRQRRRTRLGRPRSITVAGTRKRFFAIPAGWNTPTTGRVRSGVRNFDVWRSRNYEMHIKGLAVGDLDGDRLNETVLISDDSVLIYRYSDDRFHKVAELKSDRNVTLCHGGCGRYQRKRRCRNIRDRRRFRAEMKTRLIYQQAAASLSCWNGRGRAYVRIAEDQRWYFRVIRAPGRGATSLLGQQRGFENVFSGGVYAMAWQNGAYEPADRQRIPKHANVFSFTYGDVDKQRQGNDPDVFTQRLPAPVPFRR